MKNMIMRRQVLPSAVAALALAAAMLGVGMTPASAASTCKNISGPGQLCLGATIVGGEEQVQAYYEYTGSSSITGWLELGVDGGGARSCTPGSQVASSTVTKLTRDSDVRVTAFTSTSNQWAATFYKGSNASDKLGTVCASF